MIESKIGSFVLIIALVILYEVVRWGIRGIIKDIGKLRKELNANN